MLSLQAQEIVTCGDIVCCGEGELMVLMFVVEWFGVTRGEKMLLSIVDTSFLALLQLSMA